MPKRVSFQLYSARNFQPWEPILEHLAKCGYKEVEGFGGAYGNTGAFYDEPEKFRALLDKHGLTMPTGHFFPIDMFEKDKKRVSEHRQDTWHARPLLPLHRAGHAAKIRVWLESLGQTPW